MPTIVQQATATYAASAPTKTVTLAAPVTAGRSLILGVTVFTYGTFGNFGTVGDTLGNEWRQVVVNGANGTAGVAFYRVPATVGGTVTVTYTPGASRNASLWLMELSEAAPVLWRWGTNASSVTPSVTLAPTNIDGCLVLGCLGNSGGAAGLAAASGWTTEASIDLDNATTATLLGISKQMPTAGAADPAWTQAANPVVMAGIALAPASAALTNTTPAGAMAFSTLPASLTANAGLADQEDRYRLWFRFDWTAPAYNLLTYCTALAAGGDATQVAQYQPQMTIYTGTPEALTVYRNQENGIQITTPLAGAHTAYYIEVENFLTPNRYVNGVQLSLQCAASNTDAAPQGALVINDDSSGGGFPYVALNPTNGVVYQSAPFVQGERVGLLADGRTLWGEISTGKLFRYSDALELQAEVAWIGALGDAPLTSDFAGNYYACDPGDAGTSRPARVQRISAAGVASAIVTLPITAIAGIGVSRDNTILYYSSALSAQPSAVRRWDLVGNVAMSDLDAGESGYRAALDIQVMADGSILVMRRPTGTSGTSRVRRYAPDGTLLGTYVCTGTINRLSYALADDEWWAWQMSNSGFGGNYGTARFSRVSLASMTELAFFSQPQCVFGVTLQFDPAKPGPRQFHNVSCPMTTLRRSSGLPSLPPNSPPTPEPPEPEPGLGQRTIPQRRLRRATHIADGQRWMFHNRFQVDLQTGIGLASGQGADPQVMIRWSNDGGHTWSHEHWVSAGRIGARRTRALVRQIGRARTRTYEVVVSDPVPWYLAAAYLDISPGNGT